MTLRARDLMTPAPLAIAHDTPLLDVIHLFVEAHISGAPVLDGNGRVCGFITASDLLVAVDQACDEDVDEGEGEELDPIADLRPRIVMEVAAPDVIWVAADATATEIAQRMRREDVHRVLVGSDGVLEGMVTTFDLLKALDAS